MQINRYPTLAARVAKELRKQLKSEYISGGQLPSEPEIAVQFGVSRGTVRQSLTILEREGIIFRRQGAGTFVNKYVLRIQARIESAYEFSDLIRIAGFEASIRQLDVEKIQLPKAIAEMLEIDTDSRALSASKLFLADGQPAIYCIDIVPCNLIRESYELSELLQPIFTFLKNRCGQSIYMNLAEIIPEVADTSLAEILDMQPGEPLLRLDEIGHNDSGDPVLFSRIYFKDQFIRFTVLRKKIASEELF